LGEKAIDGRSRRRSKEEGSTAKTNKAMRVGWGLTYKTGNLLRRGGRPQKRWRSLKGRDGRRGEKTEQSSKIFFASKVSFKGSTGRLIKQKGKVGNCDERKGGW